METQLRRQHDKDIEKLSETISEVKADHLRDNMEIAKFHKKKNRGIIKINSMK